MNTTPNNTDGSPARPRKRSRTLVLMAVLTIVGAGMWVYAAATKPESAPPPPAPAAMTDMVRANSLTAGEAGDLIRERAEDAAERAKRFIDDGAPALFRFGFSFVAAFFAAWALKKFVKLTLLVSGAIALGVFGLQKAGVLTIEAEQFKKAADESLEFARGQAGAVRTFVTGYLPTGFAAAFGAYKGFRS